MIYDELSPNEIMNSWAITLILIVGTSLNAIPLLNLANAEALVIGNNLTMSTNSINATNPVNVTDSEDKEDANEPEENKEKENDEEEEDD